ncbi:MAG: hypothetical protein ACFFC7_23370 [Candidatus Hermodarchaeota archaeon]
MTRNDSYMKTKSVSGEDEEEIEIENQPTRAETIGRPTWWFNGSLFFPKTVQERKLATLQYRTLARADPILSERAQRIRQYISVLSQWFPLPLLDEIGKDLLLNTNIRQSDEVLLAHLLGAVEATLRQRYCTIRWSVLQEINQQFGYYLEKKDIYKWMFYTRQRKKEQGSDSLRVIQHLTIEAISRESLPSEQKRQLCLRIAQVIKVLRHKKFVCKDPEICSWALKRILLDEKGSQTNVPRELRAATTRMTFRLRQILKQHLT